MGLHWVSDAHQGTKQRGAAGVVVVAVGGRWWQCWEGVGDAGGVGGGGGGAAAGGRVGDTAKTSGWLLTGVGMPTATGASGASTDTGPRGHSGGANDAWDRIHTRRGLHLP